MVIITIPDVSGIVAEFGIEAYYCKKKLIMNELIKHI